MNERQRRNKNILVSSLLTVGLSAAAAQAISNDKEKTHEVAVSASASATEAVGGEDSGWTQGAAERAIEAALAAATAHLSVNNIDFTEKINELPTYDNASKAVEMALEDGAIPDKGDKLRVDIEVTEDSDKNISYVVTDAELIDISNNGSD
jgi:hypothetical protein